MPRPTRTKANATATGPIFQVVQKMFEQRTGTTFQYIAFRANSEAMMALMRGDALMSLSDIGPATGPLQDGRVRALAVTSPQRLPSHPDVPTMAEAGFKDMEIEFWTGLLAPAKTPAAIVQRLQDEIMAIVKLPDVVEKFAGHQVYPAGTTSEEFAKVIARELVQWSEWRRRAISRFSELPQLHDLLRERMQPLGAVLRDQEVVADPGVGVLGVVHRMHRDVHARGERHRLVEAHQRPLDQVIALAVAIEPVLLRAAVLRHEIVVAVPHVGA